MKYRVATRAVVNRVYYVEADDPKSALTESTFSIPVNETDIEEETLSVTPLESEGKQS